MKEKKYIVFLSGGKDSTAMLLRLIEEEYPIDLILFCDTGLEFPQMYDHLKCLEQYIGKKIIYLKAEHSFEYYFLEYMPKRKNPKLKQYACSSWAGPRNRWCTGVLKTRIIKAYLKELRKEYELVEYIGIAADEPKRIKEGCYPLVEWGMAEQDCLDYCYKRGFDWGVFTRYLAAFLVGVARYKVLQNSESSMSISRIFGHSFKDGMIARVDNFVRIILFVSLPSALSLKRNGSIKGTVSRLERFTTH